MNNPIDPMTLPILLKAIDFLFDEGKKIMEERRERRKKAESLVDTKESTPPTEPAPATPEKPVRVLSKEEARKSPVDGSLWPDHETQIKHLLNLLEIHAKNYHLAQKQYGMWGDALVPQIVMHNLENEEKKMIATARELQDLLAKIYGKSIEVIEK